MNSQKLSDSSQVDFIRPRPTAHQDIKHRVYLIPFHHRLESLVNVLLWEGPEKALIFCSTRQETIECAAFLTEAGFSANALHGEMTQEKKFFSQFIRTGITTCLVATDVAARAWILIW